MKPLTSTDKKKIIEQLNKQFGITQIPQLIIQFGKEKLRLYSGNLSKEELYYLDNEIRIENIGLYFAKWENDGIRLTLDGVQLFRNQITKNILELDEKQANDWLKGNDLDIKTDYGWKILKYKNEFIGCGKSTGERITNFMPKERRVKS
ncbi:Ribosomal RNA small subunit methyltransferase F [uncultured archaeon]|nr:Ribosomal RNA small subunit methyltransferase F [uncultured archaeon]